MATVSLYGYDAARQELIDSCGSLRKPIVLVPVTISFCDNVRLPRPSAADACLMRIRFHIYEKRSAFPGSKR